MIHRIYADDPRFKDLSLGPGLNILLADKSPGATSKQTRNGAGKSSMLAVIHFVLGSSDRDKLFTAGPLQEIRFGLEFDLAGSLIRAERSGRPRSGVRVSGDFSGWPIVPKKPKKAEHFEISVEDWKLVLGQQMFGLAPDAAKDRLKFRALLPYFVRTSGGMTDPLKHFAQQNLADSQILLSFLLGLDCSLPQQWQRVREQEEHFEQLKKSQSAGFLGEHIGNSAELKTQIILVEQDVERLERALASFRVLDSYHDVEREASQITIQLSELANANVLDRRYLDELQHTTVADVPPAPEDLHALYEESRILLPSLVRRRYEEVTAFHASVVRNRRSYLNAEIDLTEQRIAHRDMEQRRLDERRAELMALLAESGALEHFTALQGELARHQAKLEQLRQRHKTAEAIESTGSTLRIDRARLQHRLRQTYVEQEAQIRDAVRTFADITGRLYERPYIGTFTIDATENGPVFDPSIPAQRSHGVNNMRIFCFDMMLMLLGLSRGRSPGFLIHDSHLFDGVDERQVGRALALGHELAVQHKFQYVVTLNSDAVPQELPAGFNIEDHVLPVRLSDATETGGLFGFRFEPPVTKRKLSRAEPELTPQRNEGHRRRAPR